jgi:DNA-binding NarL/FixJ family response regulator
MSIEMSDGIRAPITMVIAVAVRLYRDGLEAALKEQNHLQIKGTAGTPLEVETAVRELEPDLVIVDVSLEDALTVMRRVRAERSKIRILAFAVREEIRTILEYAEAGADGFFTASGSMSQLVEAIERTAAGELLCSPRIAAQLLRRAAHQADHSGHYSLVYDLTVREQQVFTHLREGRSNKEIAAALNIAEATVKNHVHHVLEKLRVTTRGQAMASGWSPLKVSVERQLSSRRAG